MGRVRVRVGGWRGRLGFILWVFQPEIFNLSPLGTTLQVTFTAAYSVIEVGQM